jgi:hypothetical protein
MGLSIVTVLSLKKTLSVLLPLQPSVQTPST